MLKRPNARSGTDLGVDAAAGESFLRKPGSLARGAIVLCDHAANALPAAYGTLGLPADQLARHIAYDIGSQGVTERLAERLGVPAVMTRFSRLLIDCNRGEDDPTLIMRLSDGAIVPGNRVLDADERTRRITRYYQPYHAAIAELIDVALDKGVAPVVLSVHSFTPVWRGVPRPWHSAVLWDKDPRLALPLLEALRADPALVVGDNEPYTGTLKGDCMWRHGTSRGLAHAIVEIRQDLIASESGQIEWAARLADAMQRILAAADAAADLKVVRFFGSHTD
ncbi:MAG: N-formylglutamate amidohydrolase [Hyphomicrobium sp.]|nr:N-formylglutamate amidohydrolase [Hyphomicrobium sp.]